MTESERLYDRAKQLMPWGTQTNAKRPDESLAGIMPFFIEEGDGCRIKDVDGRWYIDYRSSLGPIILGYKHRVVDAAVKRQLEKGVLFSMASPLEIRVAELMIDLIPGLEQVRFMKTGNEVNGCAVRLARAFTGRDDLITCAYHGHGDWFACGEGEAPGWFAREGNGVPLALDKMTTRVTYGDQGALERAFEKHGDRLAAMIMVPYDWGDVSEPFVRRARELTEQVGAVLIFDQVLTGFRLARGGAQEYFGVIPDLTTYAKAIANGYPLAAYGGRRDIMEKLYGVTLTSTYAGETLSLAAAEAALAIHRDEPVNEHIWAMGRKITDGFDRISSELELGARSFGLPPAPRFRFSDDLRVDANRRHVFFRELFKRGIFPHEPMLVSYAHQEEDVDETLQAFREALEMLKEELP